MNICRRVPLCLVNQRKPKMRLCQELVFALWFCFNGGYPVRPQIFRLLCNAKPVTKSCLVSRLFPRAMVDKNNSQNLTNMVSAACRLRTPIGHSSFRTSVTLQSLQACYHWALQLKLKYCNIRVRVRVSCNWEFETEAQSNNNSDSSLLGYETALFVNTLFSDELPSILVAWKWTV